MKRILKRMRSNASNRMFDLAAGPMILMMFGMPLLLVIGVGAIVGLAYSKICEINREKKKERDQ